MAAPRLEFNVYVDTVAESFQSEPRGPSMTPSLSLQGFVLLLAGCVVPLSAGPSNPDSKPTDDLIVITDLAVVKNCTDLGTVARASKLRGGRGLDEARKQLLDHGRSIKATHIRFFGYRSDAAIGREQSGHFFQCQSAAANDPKTDDGTAIGTCFFVTDTGLAVTNRHVVANSLSIKVVLNDGSEHEAALLRQQSNTDLALLQIRNPIKTPYLIPSAAPVALGEQVFTIGFPFGETLGNDPKFVEGSIAGLRAMDDERLLQTAMIVHPGNSGGALVKLDGSLAGVVFAKANQLTFLQHTGSLAEGISFAVKAPLVVSLLGADAPKIAFVPKTRADAIDNAVRATCRVISTRDGKDFSK